MEVILRQDVDKLGLRGDVVDVARGYARNFLLPRRLAEPATPAKVAELRKRERAARAGTRRRRVEQAQEIAARLEQDELRFDVKAGADRLALRLGHARPTSPTRSGAREDPRRPAQDRLPTRSSGSAATTIPVEVFADVRRVRDAGRPRGRRAAARGGARGDGGRSEAEAEAAAQAEAEAEHAQAEAVDRGRRRRGRGPRPTPRPRTAAEASRRRRARGQRDADRSRPRATEARTAFVHRLSTACGAHRRTFRSERVNRRRCPSGRSWDTSVPLDTLRTHRSSPCTSGPCRKSGRTELPRPGRRAWV